MIEEIWKDIDGFEGLYKVSNLGQIKSLQRVHVPIDRILRARFRANGKGYGGVQLAKIGQKDNSQQVHRLVAIAFIPNPENKRCVNHKDGDKHNNTVPNLEWVTYKENMIHAVKTGLFVVTSEQRRGTNNGRAKISEDQVREIRISNKTFVALGKQFNLNRQTISSIKKHKLWKHVATIAFLSIYSLCSAQDSIWVKIPLRICDTLEFHYQQSLEYQKLAAEYLDLALLWQHKSQGISAALSDKVAEIATMKELQGIDSGEFNREKASLQQQVKDERKLKNRWKWGFWGVVVAAGYLLGRN